MFDMALYQILVTCAVTTCSVSAFVFPSSSSDLGLYSDISVTSTCSNGGKDSCNSSCPYRKDFPSFNIHLKPTPSTCIHFSGSLPSAAEAGNGEIMFNSSSECNSTQLDKTYSSSSPSYLSLTMWVKAWCNSKACNIFTIGSGLTMTYNGTVLSLNDKSTKASTTTWHFIAIRFNGAVTWFLDGRKKDTSGLSFSNSSSYKLTLGPTRNLTSTDFVHMLDVRWYQDALTDRELESLHNGNSLKDAGLKSDCRCPTSHPTLVENTRPVKYLKCTDGSTTVLRLGKKVYIHQYMLDDDNSTKWISENAMETNITLSFAKQFQMKSINLEGIIQQPSILNAVLFRDGKQENVKAFSGQKATFVFETNSVTKRSDYEKLVADKVIIQAKFRSKGFFTVSELKLEARCNCYGNDKTCSIKNGTYTCNCTQSSNTGKEYCHVCKEGYFREADEFTCPNLCACNETGSKSTPCEEEGGQCNCKDNIEGRQCTHCKDNTANFGTTGCKACSCNPRGITSCSDGLVCNCKQNVDNSTGKCEKCLQNYYGITKSYGCTACNCDSSGTMPIQPMCVNSTGQCHCKANVQGRTCNVCKDQYYGLSADKTDGCDKCDCNFVGSTSLVCNKTTGYCPCVDGKDHTNDGNRQCTPRNLHLEPTYGPVAGGTLLTLTGTLLGATQQVRLTLDAKPQKFVSKNQTVIIFKTYPVSVEGEKAISLYWSNSSVIYNAEEIKNSTTFVYKKNPQIIVPTVNIQSFTSGGCILRMIGSNLNSVAYPKMLVHLKNKGEEESLCVAEGEKLNCPTPNLSKYDSNMTFRFGFRMDGYTNYENASEAHGTLLSIIPDPVVYTGMKETYRNTFDKVFKIKGERLHEACHDSDVTITLGDKNCALLSRTQRSISCDPGEEFPGTARTVQVKVKIGNFEKVWGELKINSFWTNTEFIFIAVGASVFLILVVVMVICIVKCRNRSSYTNKTESTPADNLTLDELSTSPQKRVPNNYERNPIAIIPPLDTQNTERTSKMIAEEFCDRLRKNVGKIVKTSLIERSNIEVGKVCTHKGKKIRVVNGHYNASTSSPYSGSEITIKTLVTPYTAEEGILPEWLNNGLFECTRLQDFVNDNVLRMKGIAVDAKNIYIIYPEMSNRTLKDYISAAKEPLTDERRLELCIQVAEGMEYLSTLSVVHKDLAARNCWVSRDFEVKISDASFSYDTYPEEYLENNGRYQPVRWMAPESLKQGYYDTKSDVWSYGVLVWEVYTNGYLPYFGIKDSEVRTKVCDEQYRLVKPYQNCSDAVFQIIEECQTDRSDDRPSFSIVQNRLDNIVNPETDSQPLYENHEFTSAGAEDDMEDYVNTMIKPPPSRPPKGRKP